MYKVEIYLRVRQGCLVEGKSQRSVARAYGLNRRTVSKMLLYAPPPGYRRERAPLTPKLDPHKEFIDTILESDKQAPHKQRHTARRIFHSLHEERGFEGGIRLFENMWLISVKRGRRCLFPCAIPLVGPRLTLEKPVQ